MQTVKFKKNFTIGKNYDIIGTLVKKVMSAGRGYVRPFGGVTVYVQSKAHKSRNGQCGQADASLERRLFIAMSDGNTRRNRKRSKASKRYKVRYDRILGLILLLAAVAMVISSCVNACTGKKNIPPQNTTQPTTVQTPSQSTIVDNLDPNDGSAPGIIQTKPTQAESEDVAKYTSEIHPFTDTQKGDLVLINSDHVYQFPEDDADIVTMFDHMDKNCYSVCDLVTSLDSTALAHLDQLMEGFIAQGNESDITVIGAYRTFEEQNDKYNSGLSGFAGGCTDYHSARTFDMGIFPKDGSSSGYYSSVGNYSWIDENAADFGFIVRYPEGKENITGELARTYTFRYVGQPHAAYIKQHSICLEEYLNTVKEHKSSNPLEITAGNDLYNVYYVPANNGSDTEVPVPTDKPYTISGDNSGGFVVTVKM